MPQVRHYIGVATDRVSLCFGGVPAILQSYTAYKKNRIEECATITITKIAAVKWMTLTGHDRPVPSDILINMHAIKFPWLHHHQHMYSWYHGIRCNLDLTKNHGQWQDCISISKRLSLKQTWRAMLFVFINTILIRKLSYVADIITIMSGGASWCLAARHDALQWRHNEPDSVSNHQRFGCLLKRLFRRRSEKTSKLRVTGFCEGNSPVTGEFPTQRPSNVENVSIWWRHHGGT